MEIDKKVVPAGRVLASANNTSSLTKMVHISRDPCSPIKVVALSGLNPIFPCLTLKGQFGQERSSANVQEIGASKSFGGKTTYNPGSLGTAAKKSK